MAKISSTLALNDKVTGVVRRINQCMGSMVDLFEQTAAASKAPIDVSAFEKVKAEVIGINEELNRFAQGKKSTELVNTAAIEKAHAQVVKIGADTARIINKTKGAELFDTVALGKAHAHIVKINADTARIINKAKGTELFDTTSLAEAQTKAEGLKDTAKKIGDETRAAEGNQRRYNRAISEGSSAASLLLSRVKSMVAAYAGIRGVKAIFELSDNLTNQTARLNLLVDDGGSVDVLKRKIFQSAQDARASYSDTMDSVSKLGLNARKAFGSMDEIIKFSELINKNFKIGGASAIEQKSAMLQLTQAMNSGRLQGDEYRSIIENAPLLKNAIEDYMTTVVKAKGTMKDWAAEGRLTAGVIKAAVFNSADEIEDRFKSIPMTWADVWTSMKNQAVVALEPALKKINELANNPNVQTTVSGIVRAVGTLAVVLAGVVRGAAAVYSFFVNNWGWISPIVYGIVAAVGLYNMVLLTNKIMLWGAAVAESIRAKAIIATATARGLDTKATFAQATAILSEAQARGINTAALSAEATAALLAAGGMTANQIALYSAAAAQGSFNTALLSCPLTWIIIAVIAFIAVIMIVANKIAKTSEVATSAFGVIIGGVYAAGTAFKLFGQLIANIALGIWGAIKALCTNMSVAFHNTIALIKGWFYGLLSCVLNVISSICAVLNKLPFVEFDYSGVTSAAADYASKSEAAAASKGDYVDVSDAFNNSSKKYDLSDWKAQIDASFAKGAAKGDAAYSKVKEWFDPEKFEFPAVGPDVEATADNTGSAAKSLEKTNEELTWLRDIAEKEAVNRFTTAQVKVDMSGMNNSISSDFDLDGIFDKLTTGIREASLTAAQGVY